MLNDPASLLHDKNFSIAIGIQITPHDAKQRHIALIYRNEAGEVCLLHLAWHKMLRSERWTEDYHWIVPAGIDSEQLENLVDWALMVAAKADDMPIPYSAIFHPDKNFDSDGNFIRGDDGRGLTCATFVLALFADFGFHLAETASWPVGREEDVRWVQKICFHLLGYVKDRFPEYMPSVYLQYQQRHALRRFRPEEVAACAFDFKGAPVAFEVAEPTSLRFVKQLNNHRAIALATASGATP